MTSEPEKEQFFVVERDGGVLYTYANNVNLDWTAHDIRFRFSEMTLMPEHRQDRGTHRIEERASITVSWSEAKEIHVLLGRVLRECELRNGPIRPIQTPLAIPLTPPSSRK